MFVAKTSSFLNFVIFVIYLIQVTLFIYLFIYCPFWSGSVFHSFFSFEQII